MIMKRSVNNWEVTLYGSLHWFLLLESHHCHVSEGLNDHGILNLNAFVFVFDKYVSMLHSFYGVKTNYSADVDFSVSESIFSYYFESTIFFPDDNLVGICTLILFTCIYKYKCVTIVNKMFCTFCLDI